MKRIISLILCAAMVFALCACNSSEPAPPEPAATPEPSAQPDPVDTALADFGEAMDALLAADSLSLAVEQSLTRSQGLRSYEEKIKETVTYQDMNGESPVIFRDQRYEYFGESGYMEYYYADGLAYIDGLYKAEVSLEEFMESLCPVELISPELYEDISLSGSTISFASPSAAEAWLGDVELIDASASAALSAEGGIEKMEYEANYIQGALTVELSLSLSPSAPAEGTDLRSQLPGASALKLVPDMDIPALFTRADLAFRGSETQTAALSEVTIVEAGALSFIVGGVLDVFGSGSDMEMKFVEDQNITENGQNFTAHYVTAYTDGVYRSEMDGEVYEQFLPVEALDVYSILYSDILPIRNLEEMKLREVDGYKLIEFEVDPALGSSLQSDICAELYGDPELLSSIADSFNTTKFSGFMAFDGDSLLPTAYSLDFEGVHSIYGTDAIISRSSQLKLDMLSASAEETVTGKAPAEAEPENKAAPLFYKVSGENGQEMWLLGTIHVGDERTAYLPESIYKALDSSAALAVEVNVDALEEYIAEDPQLALTLAQLYYFTDGSSIADHIDSELYEDAAALLKAVGAYQFGVDQMKPAYWTSAIENAYMTQAGLLSAEKGVDMRLLELAGEKSLEIREIESAESQFSLLFGADMELQELMLASTIYGGRHAYGDSLEELYELWCSGDEAALTDYIRNTPMVEFTEEDTASLSPEDMERIEALAADYAKAMGPDRDAAMTEAAISYLESGETVFYAVGLAHLLSETGLVESLRAAGYTVEKVG